MLGAIAGDVIGSIFENFNVKKTDFPLFRKISIFTDDSVMTLAVADVLLSGGAGSPDVYVQKLQEWFRAYPFAGYGGSFLLWATMRKSQPYNSWGNGSAMRVSPVAYAFDTLERVLEEAEISAAVTHNHPEGIRGARAVAGAVFLARTGSTKEEIRAWVVEEIKYDLSQTIDEIRPHYKLDVSCQGSVPQAITAFLESENFEDAIRKAISIGGDSDTIACITGSIADPFYGGVPVDITEHVTGKLTDRMKNTLDAFTAKFRA
jgi:ADP-ribosylglycohydrolase